MQIKAMARLILLTFAALLLSGCAPRYSCSDEETLVTVKRLSTALLQKQGVYNISNLEISLITLQSRNEQTGQSMCSSKITFNGNMSEILPKTLYGKILPHAMTGIISYTIDQDQQDDRGIVISVSLISIE